MNMTYINICFISKKNHFDIRGNHSPLLPSWALSIDWSMACSFGRPTWDSYFQCNHSIMWPIRSNNPYQNRVYEKRISFQSKIWSVEQLIGLASCKILMGNHTNITRHTLAIWVLIDIHVCYAEKHAKWLRWRVVASMHSSNTVLARWRELCATCALTVCTWSMNSTKMKRDRRHPNF
jgi:hypothetical protein